MNKLNKIVNKGLFVLCMSAGISFLTGCESNAGSDKKAGVTERHQVQVQKKGEGMIYVDKVPCNAVMRTADSSGSVAGFQCYLIGFIDSLPHAPAADKKDIATGKYYEYDMQYDWTALANGDSLKPVFFQPKQKLQTHRSEGILVFELADGREPDTLIYKDSHGAWGVQKLLITGNNK